jgi:hypothetical protein
MKSLILFLALAAGFAVAAEAQTYTFNPTADAFVAAIESGSNFGAAGALAVAGTGDTKGEADSVIEFNLGSTAISAQSVTLQLTTSSPNNAVFNSPAASGTFAIVWMDNTSWTEGNGTPNTASTDGGITYSNLGTYLDSGDENLGTYSFTAATSGSNIYSLSLSGTGFLADVDAGGTVSLEVIPVVSSTIAYVFNSENFGTASSRPLLTVTAVPEPAGLVFAGAGLLVLAGCSRYWLRKT